MEAKHHATRAPSRIGALVGLLALLAVSCAGGESGPAPPHRTPRDSAVVLVSLDGFRPDYLKRYEAPHLRRLAREGVNAPRGMIPVFPTETFPSHYSLVTGLYPEHHGIVSNTMWDPVWKAWFRIRDRAAVENGRWWGGEPIWVTAERQGLRSATFFWVGSEAEIQGRRPTYWIRYDSAIPGAERVDQVLRWLRLPDNRRPSIVTLYFGAVDHAGHDYGPESEAVAAAVRKLDKQVGRLVRGLEPIARDVDVNLIVVSDHGMAATSPSRVIPLADFIDLDDVRIVERSPLLMLLPREGKSESVYSALKDAHPHLTVYRKAETPERWHFREHRRITSLVAVADEGWSVVLRPGDENREGFPAGAHGYDNDLESMRELFIASGPAFRERIETESFESVHLYALIAGILGIEPAANDGDGAALRHILR